VRQNGRVVWERSPAPAATLAARFPAPPPWAVKPPANGAFRYFVGEYEGDGSVDEALARAWASGMLRAGIVEFPSVADVEATGSESLHGSRFERRFAVALGAIDWSGLDEARELGSPKVDVDERTGQVRVYRLLKWRTGAIAAARSKLSREQSRPVPVVPRAMLSRSAPKTTPRRWLEALAAGGRCRGDVDLAVEALGQPDRLAREPAHPELRHYFWGSYRLTARLPERRIVGAVRQLGPDREASLCAGALSPSP
jgi:hypothetical protein